MYGIKITAVSAYVPDNKVCNADIVDADCARWAEENLGILSRNVSALDQATSDLAVAAVKGFGDLSILRDVDLLLVATATPDLAAPSTACIVANKLGLDDGYAFDVSGVCCGFLMAMDVAAKFIQAGSSRKVLLIGADQFSRHTDWSRRDAVFFGDGAGAVMMEAAEPQTKYSSRFLSDYNGLNNFYIPEGKNFEMNAQAVYSSAVQLVPKATNHLLDEMGLAPEDIDLVVPHQPSKKLLLAIAEKIGIPPSKFVFDMANNANTAGATIPIALQRAIDSGVMSGSKTVLFIAAGAGMIGGAAILTRE